MKRVMVTLQRSNAMPTYRKPSWFVVGAYKSGTTALHYAARQHPNLFVNYLIKESNFFAKDLNLKHYPVTTLDAYQDLFRECKSSAEPGEICPSYLFSQSASKAIRDFNPAAKIIILLRDPVQRALSDFMMSVRDQRASVEDLPRLVEEELAGRRRPGLSVLAQSRYREQVARYQQTFAADHLLVMRYDDLVTDSGRFFERLWDFLSVPHVDVTLASKTVNASGVPRNATFAAAVVTARRYRRLIKSILPERALQPIYKIANLNLRREALPERSIDLVRHALEEETDWYERFWQCRR